MRGQMMVAEDDSASYMCAPVMILSSVQHVYVKPKCPTPKRPRSAPSLLPLSFIVILSKLSVSANARDWQETDRQERCLPAGRCGGRQTSP
jgi:hypothetical protein